MIIILVVNGRNYKMTNSTDDKVNLIKGRVIQRKHIKKEQDTNQRYTNKVWQRIHKMEVKHDE